jgi:hypothetical protein
MPFHSGVLMFQFLCFILRNMRAGYVRMTLTENAAQQVQALQRAGVDKVFREKMSQVLLLSALHWKP